MHGGLYVQWKLASKAQLLKGESGRPSKSLLLAKDGNLLAVLMINPQRWVELFNNNPNFCDNVSEVGMAVLPGRRDVKSCACYGIAKYNIGS